MFVSDNNMDEECLDNTEVFPERCLFWFVLNEYSTIKYGVPLLTEYAQKKLRLKILEREENNLHISNRDKYGIEIEDGIIRCITFPSNSKDVLAIILRAYDKKTIEQKIEEAKEY